MDSVTFRLDEKDYAAVMKRSALANLSNWKGAVIVAMLYGGVVSMSGRPLEAAVVTLVGSALWLWMMIIWWTRWYAPRIFGQQRDLHGQIRVAWTPDALKYAVPTGETRTPWTDFHRWREDGTSILLYRSDAVLTFIPKRALTASQAAALRDLAIAAGVAGAKPS